MAGVKVGRAPKEFRLDYSSNVAEEFGLWLEDIDDYMAICKVADPREKKQLFMNLAGLELRRIVKGLVVPTPPPLEDGSAGDVYKTLTDAILAYFRPAVNTTAERHKFRKMMQRDDETVTSFVGRLRAKVELCEFASTTVDSVVNGQLRDQLVAGIKTNDIRKELLKHSKLTLADAMAKAVALETSIADSSLYECPRHSYMLCVVLVFLESKCSCEMTSRPNSTVSPAGTTKQVHWHDLSPALIVTSVTPRVSTAVPPYALKTAKLGRVGLTISSVMSVREAPVSSRPRHSLPFTLRVVVNASYFDEWLATYTVSYTWCRGTAGSE